MLDDGRGRRYPLHDPDSERDSCGIGFVARIDGTPEHAVVARAVESVTHLTHRGAIGGDRDTGDGAGILTRVPDAFLRKACAFALPAAGRYGAGMVFLPRGAEPRRSAERSIEQAAERTGLRILGWRDVPVSSECLGAQARRTQPVIRQVFIDGGGTEGDALERRLYVLRRRAERAAADRGDGGDPAAFYVSSLSSRTITYKGLLTAHQLNLFYPDLVDREFASPFAVFHQRFSTNTFPTWELAQPFRYVAHNGEINTLRGNVNRMRAREAHMESALFGDDLWDLLPIIQKGGSDSAMFDNVLELLVQAGRSIPHVMMMMIPEAFGPKYHISADKRAFYEFHAALMEPWDGPAAMVFTDGTMIGGTLDRNGLRPCRYTITKDGYAILASETGVLDIPPENIAAKGRLQPGRMFLVNLAEGRIVGDTEIKARISRRQPYRKWLAQNQATLRGLFGPPAPVEPDRGTLLDRQRIFGYTAEEIAMLIQPMAVAGQEAVGSMGTDTPPAVLSDRPLLVFDYFKQLFAQVTNPPIDPLRESLVMSLMSFMGRERNLLDETPEHARQLKLPHPILSNDDMSALRAVDAEGLRTVTFPALFDVEKGAKGLELALEEIFWQASRAIAAGTSLIILSDKGADAKRAPIPSLLATAGLHHHLIRERKRTLSGIIVETGEAREVMHFALLVGYGATAINPYLAFETLAALARDGKLGEGLKVEDAIDNYIQAIKKGLLKTFSRMGISTLRSYRGAQIFECIGINRETIDRYFTGTASRIGGIGLAEIVEEVRRRHAAALRPAPGAGSGLPLGGQYRIRDGEGERHLWNHRTVTALQAAVRGDRREIYREFAKLIDDQGRKLGTIRGLFRFKPGTPIPIEEVEPAGEIIRRFVTGAMSFGSISKEAHESIAMAMNRLGAMSNTGEGGEDPARFVPLPNGDSVSSAVKQVASARFGVTIEYLASARDLQIKIAQGAKPGEGGQLPGHKVDEVIARVRHSTPGVTLISPPPHHDIYSIEDLAQLIFDLKNANPEARISVKLVSEVGVGTVAAGVAKAHADMVLISGYEGGTGASPLTSIKHAGIPWELGLAETQQVLVMNKLRDRIRVQVDGGLRTGRDVVIAALLGAEEFGFGTAALVTQGCILMRKCHLNTCPVGVATQDPQLRKRFRGKPEYLERYMGFIADQVREIMASLGIRRMDDLIGRTDLLDVAPAVDHWKARGLDLSAILTRGEPPPGGAVRQIHAQEHGIEDVLDHELIRLCEPALLRKEQVRIERPIRNTDRATGTMLSWRITKGHGGAGLPDGTIQCRFRGSAGQSFGAFLTRGVTFLLEGDANDYLGKGLSGGRIAVRPPEGSTFEPEKNIIVGNTLLYGATSGEAYFAGVAGERFAVRMSGAIAVVEGLGDHGCEYMTGGCVAVLGPTGRNFAAGMSGGIAYVLDQDQLFDTLCNLEMVDLEAVVREEDKRRLRRMIEAHVNWTGSRLGLRILESWRDVLPYFVKVFPIDYRRALERIREAQLDPFETTPATEEVYRG